MSARRARWEIVHHEGAEQPWRVRQIAANGRKVLWSENYLEERGALHAILLNARMYWVSAEFNEDKTRVQIDRHTGPGVEVRHIKAKP